MAQTRLVFDEKERVADWVAKRVGHFCTWDGCYAMGAEKDGELVSGIVWEGHNGHNVSGHIAVSKPTKLFLELMDHAARYTFETCGLQRLTGLVEEDNVKALKLDMHIGFKVEAVMERAGSSGQNLLVLVLWPENYFRSYKHG